MKDSIENHIIERSYSAEAGGNSRYRLLKVLRYPNGEECLESPFKLNIQNSLRDSVYMVEAKFENRMDLVAHHFYRMPTVYWVIAAFNNKIDPFILEAGDVVRVPTMATLWGSGGVLK